MLFESLFTRTCSIAVAAHKSSIFHVGVEELDLGVIPIFVLSQPILGLESIVADLALMWKHRIFFLLLLLFLSMFILVIIPNVSAPRSRILECMETVLAWEVALCVR